MNPGQGFAANLSTALVVTTASLDGLPVSTTHVSVASLLGMGIVHVRQNGNLCSACSRRGSLRFRARQFWPGLRTRWLVRFNRLLKNPRF